MNTSFIDHIAALKTDTQFETSLSRGRKANTTVGAGSFAFGSNVTASGDYSFASGYETTASYEEAHAEGYQTTASSYAAHAEGTLTSATGDSSHAEGIRTIANHTGQHVFGINNVVDTSNTDQGTYVEIVGNGNPNSDTPKSNARTLKWNGDEWIAGKLTVGTGPTDNMDVATKQYVDGAIQTVDLSAYATKANPEFTGGISLGRKSGTSIGSYSSAIGENTTASHVGSHAEGSGTSATAHYSHAEGNQTTVTGTSGHAEGAQTIAIGNASHAEGSGCVAIAYASHAEGTNCVALSGHVTGRYNIPGAGAATLWASGVVYPVGAVVKNDGHLYLCLQKHRSGQYTGSFNMQEYGEDGTTLYTVWEDLGAIVNTEYAEVVGNGTPATRSNARTLDWRGNEWLAGKLTVSTAPENNMDVTTKQYVDSAIQTAGSTYATKASPVFTGSITIGGTTITEAKLQALLSLASGGLNGTTWLLNATPTAPSQTITVTNANGLFTYDEYNTQYTFSVSNEHDEAKLTYYDQYGDRSAYAYGQWSAQECKTITFIADIDTATPSIQAFLDWLHANATQQ